jgi:DivIVA domain-containing protein
MTRLRPGYAMDEVDMFIDRIERTLSGLAAAGEQVTAQDVRNAQFRTVRMKPGYDEREVDDALEQYEQQLSRM